MEPPQKSPESNVATLAGGCFWCLEAIFEQLKGVIKVESGYSGGAAADPSYERVSAGATGHAEVVQVTFDPAVISFRDLLRIFFTVHDPTTPNRQGADVGTQYRSAVFFHDSEQEKTVHEVIVEIENSGAWDGPIVTEVAPFKVFYRAEDYHQHYFDKNPEQPYCQAVIAPKVAKLGQKYFAELKR